ncbi:MAG: hypothetical protein JWN58_1682, partial [Gammaproteobacteria bacterium]|nr:hypothetical protein [Gammaproteobacteria bacterium]
GHFSAGERETEQQEKPCPEAGNAHV